MAGNLEEVLLRLNLGEDVNQMLFPRYSTPLHDATTCGRIQVAKVLIERYSSLTDCDILKQQYCSKSWPMYNNLFNQNMILAIY